MKQIPVKKPAVIQKEEPPKKEKTKISFGGKLIAIFSVTAAFVVTAVIVLSLYFAGIIGAAVPVNKRDSKKEEEIVLSQFTEYVFKENAMPKGKYAKITFVYEEKEYDVTAYLFSDYAPNTVNNFISYAKSGFYNATAVREGEIEYDGNGQPVLGRMICGGYVREGNTLAKKIPDGGAEAIKGEFYYNGYEKNTLSNTAGVIGMIHTIDNDDATTDFYILPYDDTSLNGKYAAFAKITTEDGIKTIQFLTKKAQDNKPVSIKSVTITEK